MKVKLSLDRRFINTGMLPCFDKRKMNRKQEYLDTMVFHAAVRHYAFCFSVGGCDEDLCDRHLNVKLDDEEHI